jgi:hypothetical protein
MVLDSGGLPRIITRWAQLVARHQEGSRCRTSSDDLAVTVLLWDLIQRNSGSGI